VFNHASSYFADVVWKGISTGHVRKGLKGNIELEDLRKELARVKEEREILKRAIAVFSKRPG